MVYSQAKVIAGGLAHIPIVITVFYFIMTSFNKRALEFAEENKLIKLSSKLLELETDANIETFIDSEIKDVKKTKVKKEKIKVINEISNKLEEIEKKAKDVKEKVKKKKKKEKKKKDMKRD